MKKTIKINDKEIVIRRAKFKEIKTMVSAIKDKGNDILEFLNNSSSDNELFKKLPDFIIKNIEEVENIIIDFTDIKNSDEVGDMDIIDIVELIKELLDYNGISKDKIQGFFQMFQSPQVAAQIPERNFMKQIPATQ